MIMWWPHLPLSGGSSCQWGIHSAETTHWKSCQGDLNLIEHPMTTSMLCLCLNMVCFPSCRSTPSYSTLSSVRPSCASITTSLCLCRPTRRQERQCVQSECPLDWNIFSVRTFASDQFFRSVVLNWFGHRTHSFPLSLSHNLSFYEFEPNKFISQKWLTHKQVTSLFT